VHSFPDNRLISKYYDEAKSASVIFYHSNNDDAAAALINLERYLNGLIRQWNRISRQSKLLETNLAGSMTGGRSAESAKNLEKISKLLTLEVHFYIICWDKVQKHFKKLEVLSRIPEVGRARRPVRTLLENASRARGFLEHLDNHVISGGLGQAFGFSFGRGDELIFSYAYVKGRPDATRRVALGKVQLCQMMSIYESMVGDLRKQLSIGRAPR
jgi:hypothetical protein